MTTTTILLEDRSFSYTLRFSHRRRSVQIRVPRPDCLELAAPAGMPWPKIRELVETKRAWILRQVRRLEAIATNPANAEEGTIRKLYARDVEANSVHGSDAPETAAVEISYFFNALEIVG